jgi:hypothetical protein
MSNRRAREILAEAYLCLFRDIGDAYPTLGRELSRDRVRLSQAVVSRGISLFLVDFPRIGKHLDRCLDNGQYESVGLPLTKRRSPAVVIPKFLGGLYLLVFHSTGSLREDYDVQAILMLRQFFGMAKKLKLSCPDEAVEREVQEFVEVDEALPLPDPFWVGDGYVGDAPSDRFATSIFKPSADSDISRLSTLLEILDLVSGILTSTLGPYRPEEWRFRHGPGAIADLSGPTNKYCWFGWSERLESVYPLADCGYHSYAAWADRAGDVQPKKRVARLIAVPKTYTKPRLIAAEPSEHQWCQQNLWHYFCDRSRDSWISQFVAFRDQTRNQALCEIGSRDGHLITIDLSAASDRVTPAAVACLFRSNPNLVRALAACRTQWLSQSLTQRVPAELELRKFSTMGSSVTFPVQSILFLAIALSSVIFSRNLRPSRESIQMLVGEVSVFGDDIIAPADSRDALFQLLEHLLFKINVTKTFTGRNFRESCGVDAFRGVDVTPAYLRVAGPRGAEQIVGQAQVHNNFYKKWFLHTAAYLAWTVRGKVSPVPVRSAVVGLHSRVFDTRVLIQRYNAATQVCEALVPVLKARVPRTKTNDDSAIHQFFTERPSPYTNWEHGFSQRPSCRMARRWVDVGLLLE